MGWVPPMVLLSNSNARSFALDALGNLTCLFVQRFTLPLGMAGECHALYVLLGSVYVWIAIFFEVFARVVIHLQSIREGLFGLLVVAVHLVDHSHIVAYVRNAGCHLQQG